MSARFEVIVDGAGHFARYLSSSDEVWRTSQVYTRRANAEKAVLSLARAFGYGTPRLTWNVPGVEKVLHDSTDMSRPLIDVRLIDVREPRP